MKGLLKKIIWMYWHQGFERAPLVVRKCVKTWENHNPDWEIRFLNSDTVEGFIAPIDISADKLAKLKLAHRSDLLRTQLLVRYGGVWADPTCYCLQPLGSWLPPKMDAGLFLFHKPGRDRVISNWFIAAETGNILLSKLYRDLCEYWERHSFNLSAGEGKLDHALSRVLNRTPTTTRLWFNPLVTRVFRIAPYMVYHYKFYDLCVRDRACADIWKRMPKVSADGPHRAQRFGLMNPSTEEQVFELIGDIPLQKLTWKINEERVAQGTVLDHLLKRIA